MSQNVKDACLEYMQANPSRTFTAAELETALSIRRPGVVLGQLLREEKATRWFDMETQTTRWGARVADIHR